MKCLKLRATIRLDPQNYNIFFCISKNIIKSDILSTHLNFDKDDFLVILNAQYQNGLKSVKLTHIMPYKSMNKQILLYHLIKITLYTGEQSSQKMLPGGGPQGAYLGGLIFIIK